MILFILLMTHHVILDICLDKTGTPIFFHLSQYLVDECETWSVIYRQIAFNHSNYKHPVK